jgi:asparagine synthase (glutamine-hydrolysing)
LVLVWAESDTQSYDGRSRNLDTGAQPIVNDEGTLALAVNGEIYNHRILRKELKVDYNYKTHSDCEVIIPLVRERGVITDRTCF